MTGITEKTQRQVFINTVNRFNKDFQRSSDLDLLDDSCKKTLGEIILPRAIHYLSCLERHQVIASMFYGKGLNPNLVMFTSHKTDNFQKFQFKPRGLETAIQINLNGKDYTFISGGFKTRFAPGNLPKYLWQRNVQTAKFTPEKDKTWFDYFGINPEQGLKNLKLP